MAVFISVVSHGHEALIKELGCLVELSRDFNVIVKSNKAGEDFSNEIFNTNFYWINESYGCGFGENNNIVFDYCRNKLKLKNSDYFIVLNPDVVISSEAIFRLLDYMNSDGIYLSAINLYKDNEFSIYDPSIRMFPSLIQFCCSFLGIGNSTIINKDTINVPTDIDWAAGSFLAFKALHYIELSGFDKRYFMYCEDIDICFRSKMLCKPVKYYPDVKAVHLAKHANRSVFSKHFYWHVSSVVKFLCVKWFYTI